MQMSLGQNWVLWSWFSASLKILLSNYCNLIQVPRTNLYQLRMQPWADLTHDSDLGPRYLSLFFPRMGKFIYLFIRKSELVLLCPQLDFQKHAVTNSSHTLVNGIFIILFLKSPNVARNWHFPQSALGNQMRAEMQSFVGWVTTLTAKLAQVAWLEQTSCKKPQ